MHALPEDAPEKPPKAATMTEEVVNDGRSHHRGSAPLHKRVAPRETRCVCVCVPVLPFSHGGVLRGASHRLRDVFVIAVQFGLPVQGRECQEPCAGWATANGLQAKGFLERTSLLVVSSASMKRSAQLGKRG